MKQYALLALAGIIILGGGAAAGVVLHRNQNPEVAGTSANINTKVVKSETEEGSMDLKTFSDTASGKLEDGGLNGEGTHHLVLDSNPKNSAYLVSSLVDLSKYEGKHVQVWGSTQRA